MATRNVEFEVTAALTQAEHSVGAVAQALVLGQPDMVRAAARDLHDSAHALALALRGLRDAPLLAQQVRRRLVVVAQALAMQREALLRRAAMVESALHSLVPQTRNPTYGAALGSYGGRNRGQSARFHAF